MFALWRASPSPHRTFRDLRNEDGVGELDHFHGDVEGYGDHGAVEKSYGGRGESATKRGLSWNAKETHYVRKEVEECLEVIVQRRD